MNVPCKYCGDDALKQFSFCPRCFGQICGEIQDRIISTGNDHGYECIHFQHEVELGIRFLNWLENADNAEDEDEPQRPTFNPDDPDWWKK